MNRDIVQRIRGTYDDPQVRVWMHPTKVEQSTKPQGDYFIDVTEKQHFDAALAEAADIVRREPTAENKFLIAIDGYELFPFEFDAYSPHHDVPDHFKTDPRKVRDLPATPDEVDTIYQEVLTLPAYLRVYADPKELLPIVAYHRGDRKELYTTLRDHPSPAPTYEALVDELGEDAFHSVTHPHEDDGGASEEAPA